MKRFVFLYSFLLLFNINNAFSQNSRLWSPIITIDLESEQNFKRNSTPTEFKQFNLNANNLNALLAQAVDRFSNEAQTSNVLLEIPFPDGKMEIFRIFKASNFHPELEQKYPRINAYVGQGTSDRTSIIRFSINPFTGFSAMIKSGKHSTIYIDPVRKGSDMYIVYDRDHLVKKDNFQPFECLVDETTEIAHHEHLASLRAANDGAMRQYRLAMSCTGEYASYHVSEAGVGNGTDEQKKAAVLSAYNTSLTRVNGVFEIDFAATMVLVPNTDTLIYLDANSDPWNNEWNNTTQTLIDNLIGSNNYDIGHNFNTTGGGNAGCIGCVCQFGDKGSAYTGRPAPIGDPFDIDYVAHEIGHQFGGYHTQSSDNCRSGSGMTEVEPGSASTIMGYAGICDANVQQNSDDYFTYVNIRDVRQNIMTGVSSSCPVLLSTTNNAPTASAGSDYVIPKTTAFELNGEGSDPDGDSLTYVWEQNDPEDPNTSAAPVPTRRFGPMYRSFKQNLAKNRYLPRIEDIIDNNLTPTWEVTPSVGRTLNFSFLVRDNVLAGSATASDLMKITVDKNAGPFVVIAPNSADVSWVGGDFVPVTWDVARTDNDTVNCQRVKIRLSTDGGYTYPHTLLEDTKNDGIEYIQVPNYIAETNSARVRVEGANNVFFDISNENFALAPAGSPGFALDYFPRDYTGCLPASLEVDFNSLSLLGYSSPISLEVIEGLPSGALASFTNSSILPDESTKLSIDLTNVVEGGNYSVLVRAIAENLDTVYRSIDLELFPSIIPPISLAAPVNGASGVPPQPTFKWNTIDNVESYSIQIATNPSFEASSIFFQKENILDTAFILTTPLVVSSPYYWRVSGKNRCGNGDYTPAFALHTESFVCTSFNAFGLPLFIPEIGTPTVTATIQIPQPGGVISDVNVTKLRGTHEFVGNLKFTLKSPQGTEVLLFKDKCANSSNFNLGLDDEALNPVPCPLTTGFSYKSVESLSAFDGQNAAGDWKLVLNDQQTGGGGQFEEVKLQICSNVSSSGPVIIKNERLFVRPGLTGYISDQFLLATDADSDPFDLEYTVVTNTQHGKLYFLGNELQVGSHFRQSSINAGNVTYVNNNDGVLEDQFTFTIIDGDGGFVGTPVFNIGINDDAPVGNQEIGEASNWILFPNPTTNNLTLYNKIAQENSIQVIDCVDVTGRVIASWQIREMPNSINLNVENLLNGNYWLRLILKDSVQVVPFSKIDK